MEHWKRSTNSVQNNLIVRHEHSQTKSLWNTLLVSSFYLCRPPSQYPENRNTCLTHLQYPSVPFKVVPHFIYLGAALSPTCSLGNKIHTLFRIQHILGLTWEDRLPNIEILDNPKSSCIEASMVKQILHWLVPTWCACLITASPAEFSTANSMLPNAPLEVRKKNV